MLDFRQNFFLNKYFKKDTRGVIIDFILSKTWSRGAANILHSGRWSAKFWHCDNINTKEIH